jgi:hypothetical protein
MKNGMNDTVGAAKHAYDSAQQGAGRAVESTKHAAGAAKVSAGHAFSKAVAMALEGAKAVTGLTVVMRALGVNDALRWAGLRRRPSPFASVAIFGAGMAVGAGVGVLFAPSSGADLRRSILRGFKGLVGATTVAAGKVESEGEPGRGVETACNAREPKSQSDGTSAAHTKSEAHA